MKNKQVEIEHPVRLTIGCTLLVLSGGMFGFFEVLKAYIKVDKSYLWIALLGVAFLIIGMGFVCWGVEKIISDNAPKEKSNGN